MKKTEHNFWCKRCGKGERVRPSRLDPNNSHFKKYCSKSCSAQDHINENAFRWKGPMAGYRALHLWIEKTLGRPDKCENCNSSGLKGRKIHWANKSRKYKRILSDWIRLCVSCHKKYDLNLISNT